MVRPWIRRLALWCGPLLLLILGWQLWDRHEEGELKAVVRRLTDGATRRFGPETPDETTRFYLARPEAPDDAVRYYLAAVSLVRFPQAGYPLGGALREAVTQGVAFPAEEQAAVAAVTRLNEPAIRLIAQAAGLPFVPMSAVQRYVARYVSLQALDNACALTMLEQLNRGELDAAAALLVGRIRMARVYDFERNGFNEYNKTVVLEAIAEDAALLVGRRGLSAERLSEIDRAFADALRPRDLEDAIRGQALSTYEIGQSWWGDFATMSRLGLMTPTRPVRRRTFQNAAATTLDAIEVARRPWPARVLDMDRLPVREFRVAGLRVESEMVTSRMVALECSALARAVARATTKTRALRIAIRAELVARTRGRLPERLDLIADVAGDEAFADPFTGRAMVYMTGPREVLVYGIGENGHDDGGRIDREPTPARPGDQARRSRAVSLDVGVRVPLR